MTGIFDVLPALAAAGTEAAAAGTAAAADTAATVGTAAATDAAATAGATAATDAAATVGSTAAVDTAGTAAGTAAGQAGTTFAVTAPEATTGDMSYAALTAPFTPAPGISITAAPGIFGQIGGAISAAQPYLAAAGAAGSAGSAVMSGQAQAAGLRTQAANAELAARAEAVKGQQDGLTVQRNLLATLATQRARYAASGIDIGFGSPADMAEQTTLEANQAGRLTTGNAAIRATTDQLTAAGDTAAAGIASTAGYAKAGGTIFDYASRAAARLPGSVS